MTKASSLKIADVFAEVGKAGAVLVEMRPVTAPGEPAKLPPQFMDSKQNTKGERGFAYVADHSPGGEAGVEVRVSPNAGPNEGKVSGFIDPANTAAYVAGK